MVIGYQVQNRQGKVWGERSPNEVLSSQTAIDDLNTACSEQPANRYSIVAIFDGEIKNPSFERRSEDGISSASDLEKLAAEFSGQVELLERTESAPAYTIAAAKRLVQSSTPNYSIVVPDESDIIVSGAGCGEWLPVMLYIPNSELF